MLNCLRLCPLIICLLIASFTSVIHSGTMAVAINIKALFTVYLLVNQWLLTPEDLATIKHHVLSLGQHHLVHQTYTINVVWDSCDPHRTVQVHISPYQQSRLWIMILMKAWVGGALHWRRSKFAALFVMSESVEMSSQRNGTHSVSHWMDIWASAVTAE